MAHKVAHDRTARTRIHQIDAPYVTGPRLALTFDLRDLQAGRMCSHEAPTYMWLYSGV